MMWNDQWAHSAACNGARADELFVRGAEQNRAKQVCAQCLVRTECLAEALDNNIEWGVWGGMTERERRALLRRRPNVSSWRALLQTAREEHGAASSAPTVLPAAKHPLSNPSPAGV
ncbi:MAG: WhiB family transcriptional regulator [Nocardioidaceae bacterium]